jgi:aspartyl/asparaginyl-tRNA synthetase
VPIHAPPDLPTQPRLSASTPSLPEGHGEIIGGSQRVDSYDLLKQRIDHALPLAALVVP